LETSVSKRGPFATIHTFLYTVICNKEIIAYKPPASTDSNLSIVVGHNPATYFDSVVLYLFDLILVVEIVVAPAAPGVAVSTHDTAVDVLHAAREARVFLNKLARRLPSRL
jgi:hypothetical protein